MGTVVFNSGKLAANGPVNVDRSYRSGFIALVMPVFGGPPSPALPGDASSKRRIPLAMIAHASLIGRQRGWQVRKVRSVKSWFHREGETYGDRG